MSKRRMIININRIEQKEVKVFRVHQYQKEDGNMINGRVTIAMVLQDPWTMAAVDTTQAEIGVVSQKVISRKIDNTERWMISWTTEDKKGKESL